MDVKRYWYRSSPLHTILSGHRDVSHECRITEAMRQAVLRSRALNPSYREWADFTPTLMHCSICERPFRLFDDPHEATATQVLATSSQRTTSSEESELYEEESVRSLLNLFALARSHQCWIVSPRTTTAWRHRYEPAEHLTDKVQSLSSLHEFKRKVKFQKSLL